MLDRVTLVTTTGTGPKPAPRPPPPPGPPPPPLVPGAVLGSPACHTAYPATPATINRNKTQTSPRFLARRGVAGAGSCCGWGTCTPGCGSGPFVVVAIQTPSEEPHAMDTDLIKPS